MTNVALSKQGPRKRLCRTTIIGLLVFSAAALGLVYLLLSARLFFGPQRLLPLSHSRAPLPIKVEETNSTPEEDPILIKPTAATIVPNPRPPPKIHSNSTNKKKGQNRPPPDPVTLLKLRAQGIPVSEEEWDGIPAWDDVVGTFGAEPVILGLETCEAYRQAVPPQNRTVAPAGSFNTGTNLFRIFFGRNCQGLGDTPLNQVPWGKHNMATARLDNYQINKTHYLRYPLEYILPVVLVRHPVSWMFSTCLHSYAAYWPHTPENCPHLVRDNVTISRRLDPTSLVPVRVNYGYRKTNRKKYHRHSSLIHFWKEWIESYAPANLPFPRLIVRLEDIVYHPGAVLKKLCDCAGGNQPKRKRVFFPLESVKVQQDRVRNKTGLPGSLVKGNASDTAGRLKAWKDHGAIPSLWERMSPQDRTVVRTVLHDDRGILKLLGYKLRDK